jgi:DNA-binding NtrC family response regulator
MDYHKVLVVEDDKDSRDSLVELLKAEDFEVWGIDNGEDALNLFKEIDFGIILTDLKMPKMDGLQLLERIKNLGSQAIVIVFTGYASIETAVKAMKLGAYDYIIKPFLFEEIKIILKRAIEYQQLQSENICLKQNLKAKYRFQNIIGDSKNMQEIFQYVEKIANTDSTVLISGESGTGKELIARAIHFNSDRRNKPLISVNCGAIPEDLLESEMFGHEKGAFTGAIKTRIGRFEMADGGTIFLDEITDMSPGLQVKLLRVLQEHEFERVGGVKTIKVDMRVIAATNQNLEKTVEQGKFREDLYYRLNVIPIQLPPLRERRSDIPLLVNHFIEHFNREKNCKVRGISKECMEYLIKYHWPGNVRELENMLERLVIIKGEGSIEPSELPEKVLNPEIDPSYPINIPDSGIPFDVAVNEFEKRLILEALQKSNWVKNRAAKLLRLNRTTLVEKMKRINLSKESF